MQPKRNPKHVGGTYPSSRHNDIPKGAFDRVAAGLQVMKGRPLLLVIQLEQDLTRVFTVDPSDPTHPTSLGLWTSFRTTMRSVRSTTIFPGTTVKAGQKG